MINRKRKRTWGIAGLEITLCLLVVIVSRSDALAGPLDDASGDILSGIQMQWGGHARVIGTVTAVAEDSLYARVDDGPYTDGQAEWRLKNRIDVGSRWSVETHYELVASGGDTQKNTRALLAEFSGSPPPVLFVNQPINDDRRLFDLTHVLTETDDTLVYHRLDRLNLTWTPDWGTVRLGRQALTWGDGLVFNPMDLFNPFAPTAVQRDYKTGDDMALLQLPVGPDEIQMLYLPRRDPQTGDVEDDSSSYAMKYHAFAGPIEMDVMGARHYEDAVAGLGASGYLREAAWRINAVYTDQCGTSGQDDFLQIVANLDYAWVWGGKNVYGLVEFFYNGLGSTGNYAEALADEDLMDRLTRGEMFTIGRYYLTGQIQVELHPLCQLYTTAIVNLSDPSGLLQPQVLWDVRSDFQIIVGGQWHWGAADSEFGGFDVTAQGVAFNAAPADQLYLWATYYF
jgi:hypothetical protein